MQEKQALSHALYPAQHVWTPQELLIFCFSPIRKHEFKVGLVSAPVHVLAELTQTQHRRGLRNRARFCSFTAQVKEWAKFISRDTFLVFVCNKGQHCLSQWFPTEALIDVLPRHYFCGMRPVAALDHPCPLLLCSLINGSSECE